MKYPKSQPIRQLISTNYQEKSIMKQIRLHKSGRTILRAAILAIVALSVVIVPVLAQEADTDVKPNIVLVHGAWADGSSWSGVVEELQAAGYKVTAPQFPLTTMEDNLARLRQVLAAQDGPTILAGHSFGGQIISSLGEDAPNVVGLVYVAAFGLDEGESIGGLLEQAPPGPALHHLQFDEQGFAWLPHEDFVTYFASDVDPAQASVMFAVQQPIFGVALEEVMGVPTWKSQPSWYLVATNDEAIPPDAQRLFAQRMGATTIELEASHVAMVSQPAVVADFIETAAESVVAES
jgi:pimeloyl-ACP methyl ester carboxylesterase